MPEDTPLDDILTEIAERAAEQVAQGFDTPAEIIELVTEIIEEEYSVAKLPDLVTQAVDRALQAHFAAQDGWDGKTDCDRLDEAFAALDRAGICARQHWT